MQAPQSAIPAAAKFVPNLLARPAQRNVSIATDPVAECKRLCSYTRDLRHYSRQVIRQSKALTEQSRSLRQWWQLSRRTKAQPQPAAVVAKPAKPAVATVATVATARRVPWRRLQMEDMDGEVIEWNAPEYTGG
jgi:hypothetical protein